MEQILNFEEEKTQKQVKNHPKIASKVVEKWPFWGGFGVSCGG
jgi:hypothetical protein